jgi:hypothetical protein
MSSLLTTPENLDGRRVWVDPGFADMLRKLQEGDPTKGWEGDPRLFMCRSADLTRWELWRLEDDGVERIVCRSQPGVPFDERLLDQLVAWDRRRFKKSLHDQIVERNARHEAEVRRVNDDYINEEVTPRLAWAARKDGLV